MQANVLYIAPKNIKRFVTIYFLFKEVEIGALYKKYSKVMMEVLLIFRIFEWKKRDGRTIDLD